MLEVQHIFKTYEGRLLLNDIFFQLDTGETVCLLGVDPGMDTLDTFVKRLAGLVKYALSAKQGIVSLSELAADWNSDQMLGNFFMLTCPYLFDLETVAYFGLFRNHHSS